MITFLASICLIQALCPRCGYSETLPWAEAIKQGAKRAKETDVESLTWIVMREHGGSPSRHRRNRRSTAYGLGQFLDSTWAGTGISKTSCGVCQIEAMCKYISRRYGSPSKAVEFWKRRRWY